MADLPRLTLVLGGTRSGKSAYAESLFADQAAPVYLATGFALDAEMRDRIQRHRDRRGDHWQIIEEPLDLAGALSLAGQAGQPVLVDCLTLWLGNLMAAGRDIEAAVAQLLATLSALPVKTVMVSSEVGLGIVPDNALARRFRDHAGLLHQRIAQQADRVVLVAAGLPLILKEHRATPPIA